MKHTYNNQWAAHLGLTGDRRCIVPDQVADNQHAYDGKTFVALIDGRKMRVRLQGSDYGLDTTGTGDILVRPVGWIRT